jgi:hypothetical protein
MRTRLGQIAHVLDNPRAATRQIGTTISRE